MVYCDMLGGYRRRISVSYGFLISRSTGQLAIAEGQENQYIYIIADIISILLQTEHDTQKI